MPEAPFEVLEIRARGSHAVLCRGRRTDDPLGRDLALKVLRATLSTSPSLAPRARDEARVLSRISHPNVVRVEELLTIRRRPLVVMEWVPGVSVRELLGARRAPLPFAVALEATRRTARALADVYDTPGPDGRPLHVLHRDINPANLLLTVHGQLKVVDFGISSGDYVDREASTISTVLGTLAYMAPERYRPGVVEGPRVDVYSLGVTLAEMLTGHHPVIPRDDEDRHARALAGLVGAVRPEGLSEPKLTTLRALLTSMCAYEPAGRPSAAAVAEGCAALLRGEGTSDALAAFAEEHVRPAYRGRPQTPPRQHAAWPEVAFLEEEGRAPRASEAKYVASADLAVRQLLAQEGWAQRPRELRWVLAMHPEWQPAPFVELLSQAARPWWQFWARPPEPAELEAALSVLKARPTPEAAALATQLREHASAEVAAAAVALLEVYAGQGR